MRNCFVPMCDALCKSQPRRMMFIPPKDPDMYQMWKNILPKRRDFKYTDKVCERHFRKEDIITTFDHIINGQLFQMERGRPKLKAHAIPCLNLPPDDGRCFSSRRKRGPGRPRNESEPPKEAEEMELNDCIQADVVVESESVEDTKIEHIESEKDYDESETASSDVKEECIEVDVQSFFEILYDDIFEVVLPSTLWGIHRDPKREFIAFTYFDSVSLKTTKSVLIDGRGILQVFLYGKLSSKQMLSAEISHELLSDIVSQVDEARICKRFQEPGNDSCLVKVNDDAEYCSKCETC